VGPGEPLWLDEDRQAALEWIAYDESLCPGCRTDRSETMDPAADDSYETVALRCHKCAARERAGKKFAADESADTSGLYIAVLDGPRFVMMGDDG